MTSLLDVNVLIALIDSRHEFAAAAADWFEANRLFGWATCPITENGALRILTHPGYPNSLTMIEAMDALHALCQQAGHSFWPDKISLLDETSQQRKWISAHRQVTDVYLLALAVAHGEQLATFDRRLVEAALKAGVVGVVLIPH